MLASAGIHRFHLKVFFAARRASHNNPQSFVRNGYMDPVVGGASRGEGFDFDVELKKKRSKKRGQSYFTIYKAWFRLTKCPGHHE